MFSLDVKQRILRIVLCIVLLLASAAVVFAIDPSLRSNFWNGWNDLNGRQVVSLWLFLMGCLFFPGVFRRYRAGRQRERNIPWYRRLGVTFCLIALVSGLIFVNLVLQLWVVSHAGQIIGYGRTRPMVLWGMAETLPYVKGAPVLMNSIIIFDLCWLLLAFVLLVQVAGFLFTKLRHIPAIQEG